jgi:MFS family permease
LLADATPRLQERKDMKTTSNTAMAARDRKVILSTLWIFAILNYAYADIMTLFFNPVLQPEEHQRILSGYVGDIRITQGFALAVAILMETAIVMVLLSRVLPHGVNRWANILAGLLHTAAVAWSLTGGTVNAFYVFSPPSRLPAPCSSSGTRGPGGSHRWRPRRQPSCGNPHRPAHDLAHAPGTLPGA